MAKVLDPDLLTYIVDGSPTTQNIQINTTNKTIRLVAGGNLVAADGVTGQCFYSKLKEIIRADSTIIKYALPVNEMIHDESLELINGWTMYDSTSLKMIRDCGLAYVNTSGVATAMFACLVTLGSIASGAPYFVQSNATNASTSAFTHVHIGDTFGVNELVQIYSDTNGDGNADYDYRSYVKIFLRSQGYTYDESSNTDIGYSALTYKKYNFPITHYVDANVTVDDATLDGAGYSGLSIQWYGAAQSFSLGANGPYNYHVVITAGGKTHNEIYSWVQRQLRKNSDIDAGAGTRTGQVTPALTLMDGSTLKTLYQSGVGGIHITNPSATSLNNINEADDTQAYRSYPYVAAITLEFDSYLVADAGPSKFWLFDASTYGTSGATIVNDASGTPITGNVTGSSATFTYAYSSDHPVVGVAVGKSGAKIAKSSTTITQSTANKLTFVAGQERWYNNPA